MNLSSVSDIDARAALARVAGVYARGIIAALQREYPNATQHVMTGPADRPTPHELHPAFYGCFDWHSSVHMHWALIRLLRQVPEAFDGAEAIRVLAAHLTPANLEQEARYFDQRPWFERPYGWGWALTLAHELTLWAASDHARRWGAALGPLTATLTGLYLDWLPKTTYPVRVGLHSNSAFGLARALPWAMMLADRGDARLRDAILAAARRWYMDDRAYPAHLEPGGSDFLSPALAEAALMASVLPPADFPDWLTRFLPDLEQEAPTTLFTPAVVSDPRDGQTAHLHGLNLYRAYAFRRVAAVLSPDDARRGPLLAGAERHAQASLSAVIGSDYMVEHWLASFAVLALTDAPDR